MPGKESQAWKKWKLDLRSFTDQGQRPAKQVRRVPEPKSTVLLSVSNRVSLCWDLASLRIPRFQFLFLTPLISPFPHSWAASIAPWNSHPCPKLIVFCKPTTASYSAELRPTKGYHAYRILCPWPMKVSYSLQIGISQVRKFLFPCNSSCVARSGSPVATRTESDWPGEIEAGCPSLVPWPLWDAYLPREKRNSRTPITTITQSNYHQPEESQLLSKPPNSLTLLCSVSETHCLLSSGKEQHLLPRAIFPGKQTFLKEEVVAATSEDTLPHFYVTGKILGLIIPVRTSRNLVACA